jgi:hypothetical protein
MLLEAAWPHQSRRHAPFGSSVNSPSQPVTAAILRAYSNSVNAGRFETW